MPGGSGCRQSRFILQSGWRGGLRCGAESGNFLSTTLRYRPTKRPTVLVCCWLVEWNGIKTSDRENHGEGLGRGRLGWRENNFTLIHKPGPATAWVRVLFNLLLVVLAGVFLLIKDVLGRHLALINFLHQSAALECQRKASSGLVYNGVGEPRQHPSQLRENLPDNFS